MLYQITFVCNFGACSFSFSKLSYFQIMNICLHKKYLKTLIIQKIKMMKQKWFWKSTFWVFLSDYFVEVRFNIYWLKENLEMTVTIGNRCLHHLEYICESDWKGAESLSKIKIFFKHPLLLARKQWTKSGWSQPNFNQ